jgi:MFS transporter, Spinster family, sphingosine-1-phosphate transporter
MIDEDDETVRLFNAAIVTTVATTTSATVEEDEEEEGNDDELLIQMRLPSWFAPEKLLKLFCLIAITLYLDRGVVSSAAVSGQPPSDNNSDSNSTNLSKGTGLQGEFHIDYAEYGVLQSVFVIGLLVGAPIFSELSKTVNAFKLIAIGLGACAIGDIGCAFSPNYLFLAFMRVLVGLGEASFVALAAPFIDDHAPKGKKTIWLSYLYLCIPFGVALGIVYGGIVGTYLGWRFAFFGNALLLIPLFAFCVLSEPIDLRKQSKSTRNTSTTATHAITVVNNPGVRVLNTAALETFARDAIRLLSIPTFFLTLSGFSWYSLVLGVFTAWGPKAGYALFEEELETRSNADYTLGLVTIFCGIFGTLLGGFGVEYFSKNKKQKRRTREAHSKSSESMETVADNLYFSGMCCIFAFVFIMISFSMKSFSAFIFFLIIGEFFAFMLQAPINAVVLWSVPSESRPLACALCTVAVHVFGDVPSPPIFGYFLLKTDENWRLVMKSFVFCFAVAAVVFFLAANSASKGIEKNDDDDDEIVHGYNSNSNSEDDDEV